jgi:hypothetical protein
VHRGDIFVWFCMATFFVRSLRAPTSLARALAFTAVAVALGGCVASHECTEIGCMSQVSITMRTPTGAWADGLYELTVGTDTQLAGRCTFLLPEQLPMPPGNVLGIACGTGMSFDLAPEVDCHMGCNGDACWQGCTPIPGQFVAHLTVNGTPGRVDLNFTRDTAPILVEMARPTYKDAYPNGPECGPVCRQASMEYMLE